MYENTTIYSLRSEGGATTHLPTFFKILQIFKEITKNIISGEIANKTVLCLSMQNIWRIAKSTHQCNSFEILRHEKLYATTQ